MKGWFVSFQDRVLRDDRAISWDGASGVMRIVGQPRVDRLLTDLQRLCKGALDRSTHDRFQPAQRKPTANRLVVELLIAGHDRAVALQKTLDDEKLHDELGAALTTYAVDQQFKILGGRITVAPFCVQEASAGASEDRFTVTWSWVRGVAEPNGDMKQRATMNRPKDPGVMNSGRKTQVSGEGIAQPFMLWMKDGVAPVTSRLVFTPFYFGRDSEGLQVELDLKGEELISGDHFSILYLDRLGFTLRDNKSLNGTLVLRGNEAVRLWTPERERQGVTAKEMRLQRRDLIRLERGTPRNKKALRFGFTLEGDDDSPIPDADDFAQRGIKLADGRELSAQRINTDDSGAVTEEYTLMIGETYLGASVTGGVWNGYDPKDDQFQGGEALVRVSNLVRRSLTWLRNDVSATVNQQPLVVGKPMEISDGSLLEYQGANGQGRSVPLTTIRFQKSE